MKAMLSISLVLYHNDPEDIKRLLDSLAHVQIPFSLYVVDNSNTEDLKYLFEGNDQFHYEHVNQNLGFAKAHNRILKNLAGKHKYHLIINPDVYFDKDVLSPMIQYLEEDPEAVQINPRILNRDETVQFTYKIEPRPFDLFARRFLPNHWFPARKEKLSRQMSLDGEITEIPIMSGCFMLFRTHILKEIGFLDERFFLYMEDIDFSKRISAKYKSVYFPHVHIYHKHTQGSYYDRYLMRQHLRSAVKYYNKHGWFPIW